jgi:lipid-A-disaccharide synthase
LLVYKLTRSTAFMVRQLSHYFESSEAAVGLPNILLGHKVVPELLQNEFTPERLAIETVELLAAPNRYWGMKRELEKILNLLGEVGSTVRIARDLSELWKEQGERARDAQV